MKTDADLKKDVMAELEWDPAIRATAVGVAVKDGVVTLAGHLETFAEKVAIQKALRRVAGVQAIALELDVKISPMHKRSDTEIAAAAEHALGWHTGVPPEKVRVVVENGWVTLQGEVDWDYQRRAVFKAVRPLIGVVGVSNEITLKPRATPADVGSLIEQALRRQADRDAKQIEVDVHDATVTLNGTVHSWQERDAAQGAAWSAPGVQQVINNLRIEH